MNLKSGPTKTGPARPLAMAMEFHCNHSFPQTESEAIKLIIHIFFLLVQKL